ncbi:MAG: hypothetical protein EA396_09840 [Anaerolineaceae bacterium]|nr:MAG: hypothetical protein EA396_09840 [Anaerolineaceae bacterium]
MTEPMIQLDSLVGNEFEVSIEGETVSGVFRIDNFITFKWDAATGERVHEPFRLVKMVQRDPENAVNRWLRQTVAPDANRPRRELTIRAVDDGTETRRWVVKGAWVGQVQYNVFDSASSEMVEEIITVYYDAIEESWPATS